MIFNDNIFFLTQEYQAIIEKENLPIGTFEYEIYLGADIVYIKDTDSGLWNIKLYKRKKGTPLERLMIISAFASIKRMENQWFKDNSLPFNIIGPQIVKEMNIKNSQSMKVAETVLCDIRNSIKYGFEVDFLLQNNYLSFDDIRELVKYYQEVSMVTAMLCQFNSAIAVLRLHGADISYFNDVLVSLKKYEILQIIDITEASIKSKSIDKGTIKSIFELLYPDQKNSHKLLKKISTMTLNTDKSEKIEFHIAISFAGEDREIAKQIADNLTMENYKVFYDEYQQASLWGKDLYSHLSDVYKKRAKYCLMIISDAYSKKQWTTLERQSAQARAFEQNEEYILPLRLDSTEIPGVQSTVGYVNFNEVGLEGTLNLLKQKLNE